VPTSESTAAGRPDAVQESAHDRPSAAVLVGLVGAQILFGCFHVIGKAVLREVPPLALAGLRVLVAAPILTAMAWRHDHVIPARRELMTIGLLGLLGVFANQLLFILGLQRTTAISASILMLSVPVFAAAAGALLGIERLGWRRLTGTAVTVIGALVLLDPRRLSGGASALTGDALILGNGLCYALFIVLQRPVFTRLPWRTVIAWSFLLGGLPVLPLALPSLLRLDPSTLSLGALGGVAYVTLGATVGAYALSTWAVRRSSPSLVAAATTLQPVVAVALGSVVLGERLAVGQVIGFALIATGLSFVTARTRVEAEASAVATAQPT
jgi:drug/metabolite transporter (DMT)-like permease